MDGKRLKRSSCPTTTFEMENKTRMLPITTSINIVLEVLPISIKKEKENVRAKIEKKKKNFIYAAIIV